MKKRKGEPVWLTFAAAEIGTKEIMGVDHHPRILEYHSTTSLKATTDEVPWCSAFVNWVFTRLGVKGTDSAAARSWIKWGFSAIEPFKGCIVVFQRGNSSWQGHVGFYIDDNCPKGYIRVLGGNQSNAVKISNYRLDKVLAYRQPTSDDTSIIEKMFEEHSKNDNSID